MNWCDTNSDQFHFADLAESLLAMHALKNKIKFDRSMRARHHKIAR